MKPVQHSAPRTKKSAQKSVKDIARMRQDLLAHYDRSGRTLPWRIRPEDRARGVVADPYAVWLSEIMLQQTTVAHATPYWQRFLDEFPTVTDLADAPRDRVLTLWAGLGYYARARNLHRCAQMIRDDHAEAFPDTEAALLKLPGIGAYTAAAIAAICYDEPTNVVDGNVERVIARVFRVQTPLPKAKSEIRALAGTLADPKRPGDYGQAIMDLGSRVCSPRAPNCASCPWQWACAAFAAGDPLDFPKKIKKAALPVRFGAAFIIECNIIDNVGAVLMQPRPDAGLLGGMLGFPGSEWGATPLVTPLDHAPLKDMSPNWEKAPIAVKHIFTHFELRLDVYGHQAASKPDIDGVWVPLDAVSDHALPTVMKKALKIWQDTKRE